MLVGAHVRGVASLGNDAGVRPFRAVGIQLMAAVGLVVIFALAAIEAGVRLSSYSDTLAGLDECDFWSNAERFANNF